MSVILIKRKHFKLRCPLLTDWYWPYSHPPPPPNIDLLPFFAPCSASLNTYWKCRIQASSLSGVSFCPLVGGKIRIHSVSLRKCVSLWHAGPWGTGTGRIAQAGSCFQETQMRVLSVTLVVACNILFFFFLKDCLDPVLRLWLEAGHSSFRAADWDHIPSDFSKELIAPGVYAAALIAPRPGTRQLKTAPQSRNLWNYAKQPIHREPAKAS